MHEFHGHQLESLPLKPLDDLANEAAMHAIRLDHDEGSLSVCSHCGRRFSLAGLKVFSGKGQARQGKTYEKMAKAQKRAKHSAGDSNTKWSDKLFRKWPRHHPKSHVNFHSVKQLIFLDF